VKYTLFGAGVALGHTMLDLPVPAPHALTGVFHPTAAFDGAGAPLRDMGELDLGVVEALHDALPDDAETAGLSRDAAAHLIRDRLLAHPVALRVMELQQAILALRLELRDEASVALPADAIQVRRLHDPAGEEGRPAPEWVIAVVRHIPWAPVL
jgi:hypothetical protein